MAQRLRQAGIAQADGFSLNISNYLTPAENTAEYDQNLRDFLGTRVAKWQLPARWAFIDAVPKTSVGKFDKKELRARHAAGALLVTELA